MSHYAAIDLIVTGVPLYFHGKGERTDMVCPKAHDIRDTGECSPRCGAKLVPKKRYDSYQIYIPHSVAGESETGELEMIDPFIRRLTKRERTFYINISDKWSGSEGIADTIIITLALTESSRSIVLEDLQKKAAKWLVEWMPVINSLREKLGTKKKFGYTIKLSSNRF